MFLARLLSLLLVSCVPALAADSASRTPAVTSAADWCAAHGYPESTCPVCNPSKSEIRLSGKGAEAAGGIATAKAEATQRSDRVVALARVVYDATKVAVVGAGSAGVVRSVEADIGSKVAPGATLAVIHSGAVGADHARLDAARSRVKTAAATVQRDRELLARGVIAAKRLQASEAELATAAGDEQSASSALDVVGSGAWTDGCYALRSPIAGFVTVRKVNAGQQVALEETLFEIVDSSQMVAEVDVTEADAARLSLGLAVTVTVDGLPGRELRGKLDYLAPEVDAKTRTVRGRVRLQNPDGALRANMLGQAAILTAKASPAVRIPRSALQRGPDSQIVFVRLGDGRYESRRVEAAASEGDHVDLLSGLKPGEEVVTTGSFLLKTEASRDKIGAGCCENDAAK